MTDTTVTTLLTAAQTATETTVQSTGIGEVISSAINSQADEADKIEIILTALGKKLLDLLPSLGFAVLSFIIGIAFSKFIIHLVKKVMNKSGVDSAAGNFLSSLIRILLYLVVVIIALSILNVPMTSLIAVLSAAGLAIGLALQNSLSNLAGGFIILFSKPFKAGDYIETNSACGYVESISILYTRILTLDNKTVYIPNGTVAGSLITNYTEKDKRRVDMEFGISYSDDVEKAKSIILEIARTHAMILNDPKPPFARLSRQAEDSLVIKVELWTKSQDYWQVKYDITELVNDAFRQQGITVPFRQLDIHIQKED